jgi:hypothetical protein
MSSDEFNAKLIEKFKALNSTSEIRKVFGPFMGAIDGLTDEEILETIRLCERIQPGFVEKLLK